MSIDNRSKTLPNLRGFILEQEEEVGPEEILNQQLTDIANMRSELLDQKKEADSTNNLIASETIGIDIQILDLQAQMARLGADKVRLSKEGV